MYRVVLENTIFFFEYSIFTFIIESVNDPVNKRDPLHKWGKHDGTYTKAPTCENNTPGSSVCHTRDMLKLVCNFCGTF